MLLIESDSDLRQYLPNVISTVRGESSFFDRCKSFISLAEEWVISQFIPSDLLELVAARDRSDPLRSTLCRLTASEALRRALPSLDVVLSPNGFAVVQTQNLAPASHQRVDRLLDSLTASRDEALSMLLMMIPSLPGWAESPQAEFFGQTLFPDLSIVDAMTELSADKWQSYLRLRPRVILAESRLAASHFSIELMTALRRANLRGCASAPQDFIISQLQSVVIDILGDKFPSLRLLDDTLSYIRRRPDDFPQWFSSPVADLYSPPVFQNDKNSSGYFF